MTFTLDEMKRVVGWAAYQNGDVNDAFAGPELISLWRHTLEKHCPYEFFDTQEAFDYAVIYLKVLERKRKQKK